MENQNQKKDQATMESEGQLTEKDLAKIAGGEDYAFDIEQVLSIGSQSAGTGAGRVAFNPF